MPSGHQNKNAVTPPTGHLQDIEEVVAVICVDQMKSHESEHGNLKIKIEPLDSSMVEQSLDKRKITVRFCVEGLSVGNVPPKQCGYSSMIEHSVVIRTTRD